MLVWLPLGLIVHYQVFKKRDIFKIILFSRQLTFNLNYKNETVVELETEMWGDKQDKHCGNTTEVLLRDRVVNTAGEQG